MVVSLCKGELLQYPATWSGWRCSSIKTRTRGKEAMSTIGGLVKFEFLGRVFMLVNKRAMAL